MNTIVRFRPRAGGKNSCRRQRDQQGDGNFLHISAKLRRPIPKNWCRRRRRNGRGHSIASLAALSILGASWSGRARDSHMTGAARVRLLATYLLSPAATATAPVYFELWTGSIQKNSREKGININTLHHSYERYGTAGVPEKAIGFLWSSPSVATSRQFHPRGSREKFSAQNSLSSIFPSVHLYRMILQVCNRTRGNFKYLKLPLNRTHLC